MMSRRTLVLVMFVMSMVTATAVETHRRRMKFGADGDRCTGSFSPAHILPTLSTQKFMAYRGVCRTIADCKASDPKKGEDFNKISRTGNCGSGLKCCYKSGGEVKFVGSEKGVYKSTTQSVSRSTQQLRRVQRSQPATKARRRAKREEDEDFDLEDDLEDGSKKKKKKGIKIKYKKGSKQWKQQQKKEEERRKKVEEARRKRREEMRKKRTMTKITLTLLHQFVDTVNTRQSWYTPCFSGDSEYVVAAGSDDGEIYIWNTSDRVIRKLPSESAYVV